MSSFRLKDSCVRCEGQKPIFRGLWKVTPVSLVLNGRSRDKIPTPVSSSSHHAEPQLV